jgi:hypothetical protein
VGFVKSVMGFGGVERVGDRILEEIRQAQARGEEQLWVQYSQREIGIRASDSDGRAHPPR